MIHIYTEVKESTIFFLVVSIMFATMALSRFMYAEWKQAETTNSMSFNSFFVGCSIFYIIYNLYVICQWIK